MYFKFTYPERQHEMWKWFSTRKLNLRFSSSWKSWSLNNFFSSWESNIPSCSPIKLSFLKMYWSDIFKCVNDLTWKLLCDGCLWRMRQRGFWVAAVTLRCKIVEVILVLKGFIFIHSYLCVQFCSFGSWCSSWRKVDQSGKVISLLLQVDGFYF